MIISCIGYFLVNYRFNFINTATVMIVSKRNQLNGFGHIAVTKAIITIMQFIDSGKLYKVRP